MRHLDGLQNGLTGTIPPELGNLKKLEGLGFGSNQLTGGIPVELGKLTKLVWLNFDGNRLTGPIPTELGNLTELEIVFLSSNNLSGQIPTEFGKLTNLRVLVLGGNNLSGSIPTEMGQMTKLSWLSLEANNLTGTIPEELSRLSLRQLYLGGNRLTGCIPAGLRDVAFNDLDDLGLAYCSSASVPGEPTRLSATADGQTEIDLSWTAPSDNGGADITGYRIEVSTNRSSWSDLVANTGSTTTSYSHTGLTAGSTRHYRVSAINSAGTGPASNTDSATTDAGTAPDLVVDALRASDSRPTAGASFTLNATVRNQGNGSSLSTILRYYRSTDATITASDTEVGTDPVSGLNSSGSSDESIRVTAPSDPGTYYYGACVDSVSDESDTTNNCSSAVTVTVSSSSSSGNTYGVGDFLPGVPTSGLFIPAVVSGASLSSSGGNTTITFANGGYIELQDGTRYTCQSTGGCGVHNGEVTQGTLVSQTTSALTSDLIVDPPTVNESAPAAGASFTLSATVRNQGAGSSASTTLRYYRSTDTAITASDTEVGTDSVSGLSSSGSSDESISVTAPSDAGTYYYGACVDSVSDESDKTNNCSSAVKVTVGAVTSVPGAPTGLTATANGQTQIDLSWSAPSDDGGAAITGYKIEVSTNGSSWSNLESDTRSTATSYSHTGLTAGATRHYRVSAINSAGAGPASNTDSATTEAAPATRPGAPTGLTATADGQTEIDLSWTAPSSDGGADITGYRIEVSTGGSSWSDLVADTGSTTTSYSHTGLTAGATRHYRVSAINSAGAGPASNTDSATTEAEPVSDATCTVDLIVKPGESCTYPGTSTEFSVASDGTGRFLFTSSGSKIEMRNTTINGITYTFVASKQSDGNWLVEEVG